MNKITERLKKEFRFYVDDQHENEWSLEIGTEEVILMFLGGKFAVTDTWTSLPKLVIFDTLDAAIENMKKRLVLWKK